MTFLPGPFSRMGGLRSAGGVPAQDVPPEDWRMPATVTLSSGSATAINAAQASASSKSRTGVAVAASGDTVITYQVGAYDTDLLLSFHSIYMMTETIAVDTSPDGSNWTSRTFTKKYPNFDGPTERRQFVRIPAGGPGYVRLTVTGNGTNADTIYPLLHKLPATGPWDAHLILGASRETELIGHDIVNGSYNLENAIIAAYPNRDPLIFSWAVSGGAFSSLVSTATSSGIPDHAPGCSYAYVGSIGGNSASQDRPFTEGQRSTWEGRYNGLANAFESAGMKFCMSNLSFRNFGGGVGPSAQEGGSLEYNNLCIHGMIEARNPEWWNAAEGRPWMDEYLAILYDRANLQDSTHGTDTGDANARINKVQNYFRYIYGGGRNASQMEQRVSTYESTPNNTNYIEATYALAAFVDGDPKTAYNNRISAASFAPTNAVTPTLSVQEPGVDQAVVCNPRTWTASPDPTFAYQWYADGVAITDATSSSYTPVHGDVGKVLKCRVTATNFKGSSWADTANSDPVVEEGSLLDETVALLARMSTQPDETLTGKINTLMAVLVDLPIRSFVMYGGMHDNQAALLDWFNGSLNHSIVGTMNRSAGGFTLGASSSYISTGKVQAELFGSELDASMGIGLSSFGLNSIIGRPSSEATIYGTGSTFRFFSSGGSYSWSAGNFIATRIDSAGFTVRKNTAARSSVTATSSALDAGIIMINRAATSYGSHTYSHFFTADALTEGEEATLNAAIAAFLS